MKNTEERKPYNKSKKTLTMLNKIQKLKKKGLNNKQIAKEIGVKMVTLYKWAESDEAFKKVLEIGSKEIDTAQLEKLGAMMATMDEVAAFFEINKSTLSMRPDLMEIYNRGKEKGKLSLRRNQFKLAEKSASMAIWLGKQYLDQKDIQQLDMKEIDINWEEVKNYN